jgi:hypothetical protein
MAGDKQKSSLIGVMRLGVMVLLGDVFEVSPLSSTSRVTFLRRVVMVLSTSCSP